MLAHTEWASVTEQLPHFPVDAFADGQEGLLDLQMSEGEADKHNRYVHQSSA